MGEQSNVLWIHNDRKDRHWRVKSYVTINTCLPEASYPSGNYSDISCLKHKRSERSWGPHFILCILLKIKINLSFVLLYGRFLSSWAHLRTPALLSNRCTASVKFPTWHWYWSGVQQAYGARSQSPSQLNMPPPHLLSVQKAKNSGILASRNGRSCHVPT